MAMFSCRGLRVLGSALVAALVAASVVGLAAPAGAAKATPESFAAAANAACSAWSTAIGAIPPPTGTTENGVSSYDGPALSLWYRRVGEVFDELGSTLRAVPTPKNLRQPARDLARWFVDEAEWYEAYGNKTTGGVVSPTEVEADKAAYFKVAVGARTEQAKALMTRLDLPICLDPSTGVAGRVAVARTGAAANTSVVAPGIAPSFGYAFQQALLDLGTRYANPGVKEWGVIDVWRAAFPGTQFIGPTTVAAPGQVSVAPPVTLGGKAGADAVSFAIRDQTGCWGGIVYQKGTTFLGKRTSLTPPNCTADRAMQYFEQSPL